MCRSLTSDFGSIVSELESHGKGVDVTQVTFGVTCTFTTRIKFVSKNTESGPLRLSHPDSTSDF